MRRIDALDDLPVDDAPLRSALRVQVANESLPPTVAEV